MDIPLHPVSKTWVLAALAIGTLESMDFINPLDLVFLPSKLAMQPWRLVTAFCYFGPLSAHIIHNLLFIARTFNDFEGLYTLDIHYLPSSWAARLDAESRAKLQRQIEANRTVDFAHFTFRVALSIATVVVLLSRYTNFADGFFFLGPSLGNASVYIASRKSSDVYFPLMGVQVRAKYAPFLATVFEFLLSREFEVSSFWPLGNVHRSLRNLLFSRYVGETVVVMLLAHVWWFVQFFYLESMNNDFGSERKDEKRAVYAELEHNFSWLDIPNMCRYVIAPPWYYFITKRLKQEARSHSGEFAETSTEPLDNSENEPENSSETANPSGTAPDTENVLETSENSSDGLENPETEIDNPQNFRSTQESLETDSAETPIFSEPRFTGSASANSAQTALRTDDSDVERRQPEASTGAHL